MPHPPIYGFDLSTSAPSTAINTATHRITRFALSTPTSEETYDGDEGEILQLIDHRMAVLPPGTIVTWQGSILDFPLIAARAQSAGLETGLRLRPDHRPAPTSVLESLEHPWCGDWYSHGHLELRRLYDATARWWDPMRTKLDPTDSATPATGRDPLRDARLARVLAERRWEQAQHLVDRMPAPANWTPPLDDSSIFEQRALTQN